MKVNTNITLFTGAQDAKDGSVAGTAAKGQENRKTIFAGNMNPEKTFQDRVAEKKAQAQQKAMKIVGDVFANDKVIDDDMENRREHVRQLGEEHISLVEEKKNIETQMEDLDKALEAGDVTQEEYVQMRDELLEAGKECNRKIGENESTAAQENAVIRGTRLERLKKSPMVKAQKEAEEVLKAARDEIIGMAMEEGKDHIDEAAEEREEKAEKIKEEREKQEEFIEKQKEKREEEESWIEELKTEDMASLIDKGSDVQKELQEMLRKMKLLEDDLKGAAVDETL